MIWVQIWRGRGTSIVRPVPRKLILKSRWSVDCNSSQSRCVVTFLSASHRPIPTVQWTRPGGHSDILRWAWRNLHFHLLIINQHTQFTITPLKKNCSLIILPARLITAVIAVLFPLLPGLLHENCWKVTMGVYIFLRGIAVI